MKRKLVSVLLCLALIITLIPSTVCAADTTSTYTKVKTSDFTKLTYGKLTKKQVGWVLEGLIGETYGADFPLYLGPKKINKMGYNHEVNLISLLGIKTYFPGEKQRKSGLRKDMWCEAHPLKRSNKILSFYTKHRLKKNKKLKKDGYYIWRTTSKRVYYYLGMGNPPYCKITSAKKNSKYMILKAKEMSAMDPDVIMSKYTVKLKKQKNGRFKLYSIKETWRSPDYQQEMD